MAGVRTGPNDRRVSFHALTVEDSSGNPKSLWVDRDETPVYPPGVVYGKLVTCAVIGCDFVAPVIPQADGGSKLLHWHRCALSAQRRNLAKVWCDGRIAEMRFTSTVCRKCYTPVRVQTRCAGYALHVGGTAMAIDVHVRRIRLIVRFARTPVEFPPTTYAVREIGACDMLQPFVGRPPKYTKLPCALCGPRYDPAYELPARKCTGCDRAYEFVERAIDRVRHGVAYVRGPPRTWDHVIADRRATLERVLNKGIPIRAGWFLDRQRLELVHGELAPGLCSACKPADVVVPLPVAEAAVAEAVGDIEDDICRLFESLDVDDGVACWLCGYIGSKECMRAFPKPPCTRNFRWQTFKDKSAYYFCRECLSRCENCGTTVLYDDPLLCDVCYDTAKAFDVSGVPAPRAATAV